MKKVKVGIFKCGNIGSAPLLELLIDELADREDISVRSVTTGAKMLVEEVEEALPKILDFNPDFIVFTSPNPAVQGPTKAREMLLEKKIPSIFISDAPGKRLKEEFEKNGFGYIIVMGDPLIGARKEFLDPSEMALFNSNVIKVLAVTGVYRMIYQEIDRVILGYKEGLTPELPRLIIDTDSIRDNSDFKNPYAKAKAMAAYELTKKVAEINTRACFMEKEKEKYIPLVACAHEIAQVAAKLAEEAREIEKYADTLIRRPHSKDGRLKIKEKLMLPLTFDDEIYQKWLKPGKSE
ncbi:MAG: F420-dependent methylenetetrahydromethanopterin dehydrogenase [Candidatus Bathyarchaeales archaeon]